jgi:segregation and condensation protein A
MHTEKLSFTVHSEQFTGPFDLMLSLIAKKWLELSKIVFSLIVDDFIEYTNQLSKERSIDEVSEFLLIASTLLSIKTADLLPSHDATDDVLETLRDRDLLFARLLQYKAFKEISKKFQDMIQNSNERFVHPENTQNLNTAREFELGISAVEFASLAKTIFEKETLSTDHLIIPEVDLKKERSDIAELLFEQAKLLFSDMIARKSRAVVIARFLILLEMYKNEEILFQQEKPFSDLYILKTDKVAL